MRGGRGPATELWVTELGWASGGRAAPPQPRPRRAGDAPSRRRSATCSTTAAGCGSRTSPGTRGATARPPRPACAAGARDSGLLNADGTREARPRRVRGARRCALSRPRRRLVAPAAAILLALALGLAARRRGCRGPGLGPPELVLRRRAAEHAHHRPTSTGWPRGASGTAADADQLGRDRPDQRRRQQLVGRSIRSSPPRRPNGISVLPFVFGTPDWVATRPRPARPASRTTCELFAPQQPGGAGAVAALPARGGRALRAGRRVLRRAPLSPRRSRSPSGSCGTSRTRRRFYKPKPDVNAYATLVAVRHRSDALRRPGCEDPARRHVRHPRRRGRAEAVRVELPAQALSGPGDRRAVRRRRRTPVRGADDQGDRAGETDAQGDPQGQRPGRDVDHRDRLVVGHRRQPARARQEGAGERVCARR